MPTLDDAAIQAVVEAVFASKKYETLSPVLVHAVATAEARKGRSFKETVKATKNQLHQSAAVYQSGRMDYHRWLAELGDIYPSLSAAEVRPHLRPILAQHRSTAERLAILDRFYPTVFAHLPPIRSVLDVACGLNPLCYPWMPLPSDVTYFACDVFRDQIDFLNHFFTLAKIRGMAEVRDVIHEPPPQTVDLALLLKTIPCLEQIDRQAGAHLLNTINARYLVVTFPVRSLGGQAKGMNNHYAMHFESLIAGRGWQSQRIDFVDELVFVVTTDRALP